MKKILYIILVASLLSSCGKDDFENNFDMSPSQRVQAKAKELKELLSSSEHGWKATFFLDNKVAFGQFFIMDFTKDNQVSVSIEKIKDVRSEYTIFNETDMMLSFNTYNRLLTSITEPTAETPHGYYGDIDFFFDSYTTDKVVLRGKAYGGILTLERANEADRDLSNSFEVLKKLSAEKVAKSKGGLNYMTLHITKGLEGASVENPVKIGFNCSTWTRTVDIAFNYKGKYTEKLSMLVFTGDGFFSAYTLKLDDKEINKFVYNEERNRFEVEADGVEGHFECYKLPQYDVDGICDDFLNQYSLKMKRKYGDFMDLSIKLKLDSKDPVTDTQIKSIVLVTDYRRRIPLFNPDGTPVLTETYEHDYKYGDHLGNGLLFSFSAQNQFYFYFVPLEATKLSEDKIKFSLTGTPFCTESEESIVKKIQSSKNLLKFLELICNEKGYLVQRLKTEGNFDFDFISLENPENQFVARNY